MQDHGQSPAFRDEQPRTRYLVVRQENVWFIKFDGEDYGPYASEREALMFAVNAAHDLGRQGEMTEVLVLDYDGNLRPHWTLGQDPYPPHH
jgi:hypothetical protein